MNPIQYQTDYIIHTSIRTSPLYPAMLCTVKYHLYYTEPSGTKYENLRLSLVNGIGSRVLARIFEMPVRNSNLKMSACPTLATQLLEILTQTAFGSPKCQKVQFTHHPCIRKWFVRSPSVITSKMSWLKYFQRNFCPSNKEVFRKLLVQQTGYTAPG